MSPARRQPLPNFLTGTAFTVQEGRAAGVGRGRLRGRDLSRPWHGVRVAEADDEDDAAEPWQPEWRAVLDRCRSLLPLLSDAGFFSHLTAGQLWPLPLPFRTVAHPLHVCVRTPAQPPRRPGLIGHETKDSLVTVVHRHGLPVVDPASLFCQLAATITSDELVAVGDALVLRPVFDDDWSERPWATVTALRERVDAFSGRGKRRAVAALQRVRPGAESRPETLVRLALVDAGLPEPEVNVDIHDQSGCFVGRGDLVYRRWRVAVEYDGDQHRVSTTQFDRDIGRLDDLAAAGWRVVRVSSRSFFLDRQVTIERVARALAAAGWRPS